MKNLINKLYLTANFNMYIMYLREEFIHSVPELTSFVQYTAGNYINLFMRNKKIILKKPSG